MAHTSAAGRAAGATTEDEDGDGVQVTDQDDDDEHVKLLNPVKVHCTPAALASDGCHFP